jgi:hypothetical protein
MVALTGLLPSSCTKTKSPTAQQHTPVVNIVNSSESNTNQNLGQLELTNHYETCVNLGAGKSCTITPNQLDRSNLQLTMSVESKNTEGKVEDLNVVQVVAKTGKPFDVAVGNMNLTFTPLLAE